MSISDNKVIPTPLITMEQCLGHMTTINNNTGRESIQVGC